MDRGRIARGATAIGAALLLVACSNDSGRTTATTTTKPPTRSTTTTKPQSGGQRIEVTIANGEVQGGVSRETVDAGSEVTLAVTADVSDEVHLHGYDQKVDVTPGTPAELTFTANIPGVFEVELEDAGLKILEIEVR